MCRIAFLIFFATASCNTYAEWLILSGNVSEASQKIYIDSDQNTVSGTFAKVWLLVDFPTAQVDLAVVYQSQKLQVEIDCEDKKIRTLSTVWFSENMGNGRVVRTFPTLPPGTWINAIQNSFQHQILRTGCKYHNE